MIFLIAQKKLDMIQGFENNPHFISPSRIDFIKRLLHRQILNFEAHMRTYRAMNRAQAKHCILSPR